ncbi:hypothetical protein FOMPIDRAFT_1017823 [Fomitopsis schrenkii]|uniref:Uncharacterized protein n=1 Tax=Fomitopsis schrenkii TaxID=2126942 RepID=S8DZ74_FOMSC|nr:hypothetical protein FOMPIDRAFT_1017823 [Fomitopsis schrenkii]
MWAALSQASGFLANKSPIAAHAAMNTFIPEAATALSAANIAIATSNASGSPSGPGLVSASLTLYIIGKMAHTSSALSSTLQMDNALHVTDFANRVCASEVKDTARIVSIAMLQSTSAEEFVVQRTNATLGHRFVVATVELKDNESARSVRTFVRVDFWGGDAFQEHPISQVVMLSDDPGVLLLEARELGRVSAGPECGGPTLGEFASLLEIIHSRTPDYSVLVRNCYWHSETIFLCVTRAYSADWLAGSVTPHALMRWIQRECDSVACIMDMVFAGGPLENFTAVASMGVGDFRSGGRTSGGA